MVSYRMFFRLVSLVWLIIWSGGAGAVTYANKSIPFNWINTSTHAHVGYNTIPYKFNGTIAPGTGCGTAPPILDDTISDAIPFGFNFNYGGIVFTSVRIMSNGRLQFNNNTACGYGSPVTQLPYVYYNSATDNLNYSMRIYGNDLDPTPQANAPYTTACASTATCYISYASIGTSPNRQFVVTWNNIPEWAAGGSTSGKYYLQVILNEDSSFIYQYGSDTAGPQATLAQVGWQVSQTDYDIPSVGLPANNSAILFYIPSAVAQYHFQQSAWTAPGQVLDTSGSTPVYNGSALGSAVPGPGYACNGAVIPNNNGVTVDGIDTGIPVPTALGGTGTIDFWYNANAAWVGGGDVQLLDATTTNNQWFFAVKRNNGNVRFVITDSNNTQQAAETGANNIAAGVWTHIALTWNFNALAANNSDHMRIYINGVQAVQAAFTTSGTVSSSVGTLYLGDNRSSFTGSNGTKGSANGMLDEVNIYNFEGGTGLVQRDMNYTASCSLDHLLIQSSGSGLTCAASTLTVVACQDAACITPSTAGVSGTLSVSGPPPTVNWDGTTGGAAGAGFIIPVGSSSVTKNVQVATAGTVTFGISSSTPVPPSVTVCSFGNNAPTNNNCVFTASTAGFIFSNTNTGSSYTIPAQVSGIATAANALYLRALQASTTNPAVCTPAIISQTTTANMGYTCNDPSTCQTGNLVTINSTTIAGSPNSNPTQNSTSVSLDFDANGSAPITALYDDVGQITLNANKTVTPFGGATAVTLIGNSNPFVVAPHHFGFSGITAGPIKAGNNFSVTVTAYNGLAIPTATANFGKESVAESATLAFTKCQPTGTSAVNGTFSGSVGSFNNGAASATNLNWSEVGNGDLLATLSSVSYLGSGLTATGNTGTGGTVCGAGAGNVGRFIPDHFDTAIINGCLGCGFTYSGQPFTVFVSAMNGLLTPGITVNYDGTANTAPNFAKAVTLSAWDTATGATQNPGPGTLLPPANTAVALTAFSQGVASLNTAATNPFYTFTTVPTLPTMIRVRSVDSDSVTSLRVPLSSSIEGQPEIRSGRIKITNAYGSELLQLPIAVTAEYWKDGISGWLTSATDSSSNFVVVTPPATSAINFANFKNNLTTISVVGSPKTVTLSNGSSGYTLASPGANKNGSVDMSIPALTGASCYVVPVPLGCYLPSNAARATFGVYKGNNNFIYQRENY